MTKYTLFKDGLTYKVDPTTGELKEASLNVKIDDDAWMMFFFKCISSYIKLTGNQMRLLVIICKVSTYNANGCKDGNIFTNSPLFKLLVRSYGLDWSDLLINNEISRLAKTDLLIKVARGSYILNPDYFFKGTLADRTKLTLIINNINNGKQID